MHGYDSNGQWLRQLFTTTITSTSTLPIIQTLELPSDIKFVRLSYPLTGVENTGIFKGKSTSNGTGLIDISTNESGSIPASGTPATNSSFNRTQLIAVYPQGYGTPYLDTAVNQINESIYDIDTSVIDLDNRLKTFFWPGDSSFSGAFAVGKGESDGLDVTNANTYGYNVRIQPSAVSINYNKIKFTQWDANELAFYEPKIVNNNYTQGNKALEISADGLKLFKHYTNVENSPSVAATLTTEGLAITDGFINLNDGKFIVNSDGQANMQDILIKGEITGQMIADSIAVTDYGSNVIKGSTTEFKSYELSTDTQVNSNKTYYTRSTSNNSYVYTRVSTPSGDPSAKGYYEDVVYMAKDLYISPYNSDPIQRIEAGIEITQDGIYFTQKYSDLPNSKIIIGLIAGAGDAKRPSTDFSVNSQKTYYTRKSSGDSYIYTEVSNPSGNPSIQGYYETIPLSEEFIIENLKPKRIIFGELEMFEYNNGLAIRRKS